MIRTILMRLCLLHKFTIFGAGTKGLELSNFGAGAKGLELSDFRAGGKGLELFELVLWDLRLICNYVFQNSTADKYKRAP